MAAIFGVWSIFGQVASRNLALAEEKVAHVSHQMALEKQGLSEKKKNAQIEQFALNSAKEEC